MAWFNFLGWTFGGKKDTTPEDPKQYIAAPVPTDGALNIETSGATLGGSTGQFLNIEGTYKNDSDLINRYRSIANQPVVDIAIQEIINEAIVTSEDSDVVELVLDKTELPEVTKNKLVEEFDTIINLLDFNRKAYDIFRTWYVDARLYYQKIIKEDATSEGIQELRFLDPRKVRKIREIKKGFANGREYIQDIKEYYIYNETMMSFGTLMPSSYGTTSNLKQINPDCITYVNSGLYDHEKGMVISHIHKAMKPHNQVRMIEDALVIYRMARAPERRVFKIDVGNLPPKQAEKYLQDMMSRYHNKMIYDVDTGEVRDDRNHMNMLDDFWIAVRDGKGTDISNLPGGCLTLDTKIPLLDGRTVTIETLIKEHSAGKQNWVFSCDPNTGAIKPGKIDEAQITQKNADIMQITFDNGKTVKCTPNHKWPVWGKGKIEAKDICVDDSVIAFNTKNEVMYDKSEYLQVFDHRKKEWVFVHRNVFETIEGTEFETDFRYQNILEEKDGGKKSVIHHIDVNKYNNNPDNLAGMGYKEHWEYHSSIFSKLGNKKIKELLKNSPEFREKIKLANKQAKETRKKLYESLTPEEKKTRGIKHSIAMKNYLGSLTSEQMAKRNAKNICRNQYKKTLKYLSVNNPAKYDKRKLEFASYGKRFGDSNKTPENRKRLSILSKKIHADKNIQRKIFEPQKLKFTLDTFRYFLKVYNTITPSFSVKSCAALLNKDPIFVNMVLLDNKKVHSNHKGKITPRVLNMMIKQFGYSSNKDLREKSKLFNHRVTKIEFLSEKEDVANLTIDKYHKLHDYHTFALDIGVFTGNSHLDSVEDLNYFKELLYKSLNVPISRLQTDAQYNLGKSSEITRDEVKFAKFIDRLRTKFSEFFIDILKTQVVLKGIMTEAEFDDISSNLFVSFQRDNFYSELKEADIMASRIEALKNINEFVGKTSKEGKYFSKEFVYKKILRLSDEEIQDMTKEASKEPEEPAEEAPGEPGLEEPGMEESPVEEPVNEPTPEEAPVEGPTEVSFGSPEQPMPEANQEVNLTTGGPEFNF